MEWFARAFVQASLVWLALGVTVGTAMAMYPAWTFYRPVHMHMTLLGFVAMIIYGIGYHVLPRFAGRALWSRRLPTVHVWASNAGLALMCVGFVCRVNSGIDPRIGTILLSAGGMLSAGGAYLFAFNIWRTIGSRTEREARVIALADRGARLRVDKR